MCTEIRSLCGSGRHAPRRKMRHRKPIQQQRPSSPPPLPTTPRPRSNLTPQRIRIQPEAPHEETAAGAEAMDMLATVAEAEPNVAAPRVDAENAPADATMRRCRTCAKRVTIMPNDIRTCDWSDESAANDCERRADPTTCTTSSTVQ